MGLDDLGQATAVLKLPWWHKSKKNIEPTFLSDIFTKESDYNHSIMNPFLLSILISVHLPGGEGKGPADWHGHISG
jgi:hypothetical protein